MATRSDSDRIGQLRQEIDAGAADPIASGIDQLIDRVTAIAKNASVKTREQLQAVAAQIRDRPLTSIVVGVAAGWFLGRVIR